jgi:hypothetical protein
MMGKKNETRTLSSKKKKKVDRDGLFQFRCLYQEARKYRGEFHV